MIHVQRFAALLIALFALSVGRVHAEDPPPKKFEVHDWSVWIAEPNARQVNSRELYPNTLPTMVNSMRNRALGKAQDVPPAPLGGITFYGEAVSLLDVELRVASGRFLAHWPPAEVKTGRLRWFDAALVEKPDPKARMPQMPSNHWFAKARELGGMCIARGARAEHFLAYDPELNQPGPLPIKLEGGPDKYTLTNFASHPLLDVVIAAPSAEGVRVAWLDEVPAAPNSKDKEKKEEPTAPTVATGATITGTNTINVQAAPAGVVLAQPVAVAGGNLTVSSTLETKPQETPPTPPTSSGSTVEVTLSAPLASGDVAAQTSQALKDRLLKTGLTQKEVDLIVDAYAPVVFGGNSMIVLYRMPSGKIEEMLPLVVEPDATKTVRVALVVTRNIDPKIRAAVDDLVKQLGDRDYKVREAAEMQLIDLGAIAFEALRAAEKNTDPEIVFRARRILRSQDEKVADE